MRISTFYGAERVVELSRRIPNFCLPTPVVWQHGWQPNENRIAPETVVDDRLAQSAMLALVSRTEEHEFLEAQGVRSVAVGLPFAYARDLILKSKTLSETTRSVCLLVPLHSSSSCPVVRGDSAAHDYARMLRDASDAYPSLDCAVLIHPNDLWLGREIVKLTNAKLVMGADIHDSMALVRLAKLFAQTSVLLSDSVGSHIPYALSMGASVALNHVSSVTKAALNPEFHNSPGIHQALMDEYTRRQTPLSSPYAFLWRDPSDPFSDSAWGRQQIGVESMQTAHFWNLVNDGKLCEAANYCRLSEDPSKGSTD